MRSDKACDPLKRERCAVGDHGLTSHAHTDAFQKKPDAEAVP